MKILSKKYFCFFFLCVSTFGFAQGSVVNIPIINHSFEMPIVNELELGTVGQGWVRVAPNAGSSATGLVSNQYGEANNYPVSPAGSQYIYLTGRKTSSDGFGTPNRAYQQVLGGEGNPVVNEGYVYTLTVSMANLSNDPTNFSFGLYSDSGMLNALAVRDSSTITLSNTEWVDFFVTWTATSDDIGKTVYVGFSSYDWGTNASTPRLGIDNVRLDAVIPEPASTALVLGSVILGFVYLSARRRNA